MAVTSALQAEESLVGYLNHSTLPILPTSPTRAECIIHLSLSCIRRNCTKISRTPKDIYSLHPRPSISTPKTSIAHQNHIPQSYLRRFLPLKPSVACRLHHPRRPSPHEDPLPATTLSLRILLILLLLRVHTRHVEVHRPHSRQSGIHGYCIIGALDVGVPCALQGSQY